MPNLRKPFGGLKSDLSPLKLRSATAVATLNAVIEDGRVKKRMGFGEFEDAVASTTAVLGLFVAHFDCGTWVIAKLADGGLYVRRVYPTDSGTFAQLTTRHTLSSSDAGWAYMYRDRFVYCERGGVGQWHPYANGGIMVKAGLPKPDSGPIIAAAALGQLQGRYHVHYAYYCKALDVEGVVSEPSRLAGPTAGALKTWLSDEGEGGITVSTYHAPYGYECDMTRWYRTAGNTEYIEVGSVAREVMSYKAALDVQVALGETPAMGKADTALDWSTMFTNAGGEPPPSRWGAWTGAVCVYAGGSVGTKASKDFEPSGANNDYTVTAKSEGYWGNRVSVEVTVADPVVEDSTPSITVTEDTTGAARGLVAIVIEVNNGVAAEDKTTAAEIVAELTADATAALYVDVALATDNDGTGTVTSAVAVGYLSGGVDAPADMIYYSAPFKPTMVPKPIDYSASTDAESTDVRTIEPKPYRGEIVSGLDGRCIEAAHAGGTVALFTHTATYRLRSASDGRLYPTLVHGGVGCVGHGAACNAGTEIHAIGYRNWTVVTAGTWQSLSDGRFKTTLEEIPAAQQDHARMACYHHADQVWAAVVKADETAARRILVWDRGVPEGALLVFEPAVLGATEGISWMVELSHPGETPKMLLATTSGRIFEYPATSARDSQTIDDETAYTDYAAYWTGVWGAERAGYSQKVTAIEIHCGANCAGYLGWTLTTKRTADDDGVSSSGTARVSDGICTVEGTVKKPAGRLYELKLGTEAVNSGQWAVEDVTFQIERTDKK